MPTLPNVQPAIAQMHGRPFSKFSKEIESMGKPTYPLHIGDTYLDPMEGARMEDVHIRTHSTAHKYTKPKGYPSLVASIARTYAVDPERVQITPGATGGLHLLAMSLLAPGDEVIILAPYWPLASGIVRAVGAVPISVPFYDRPGTDSERIAAFKHPRTVEIYVNTPTKPQRQRMKAEAVPA